MNDARDDMLEDIQVCSETHREHEANKETISQEAKDDQEEALPLLS